MPLYSALRPSCWKSVRAMETVCERLEGPGGVGLRWTSVCDCEIGGWILKDLGGREEA